MLLRVVAQQIAEQPFVRLGFGVRLMKVVQRFVGFLDGTERSLYLALGPSGHAGAVFASGHMGLPGDPQRQHHGVKHAALGHGTIIEVEQLGSPLEREGRIRFRRHRVKQEAQGAFGVLAIHTAVFHVTDATAVIDDTKQH